MVGTSRSAHAHELDDAAPGKIPVDVAARSKRPAGMAILCADEHRSVRIADSPWSSARRRRIAVVTAVMPFRPRTRVRLAEGKSPTAVKYREAGIERSGC